MRSWSGILVLAFVVVACAHDPPPLPEPVSPPKPIAAAKPVVVPVADAGAPVEITKEAWAADYPTSWRDARVIAALAADCDFAMPERPWDSEWNGGYAPADLFQCKPAWSQSCTSGDICWGEEQTCDETCGSTCTSCSGTCSESCKSCKTTCKDDACKTSCATTCADCKEKCNRTMDRCASGTCKTDADACYKRYDRVFDTCKATCAPHMKCLEKCADYGVKGDYQKLGPCNDSCRTKRNAKFEACAKKCGEDDRACRNKCTETTCPTEVCEYHLQ